MPARTRPDVASVASVSWDDFLSVFVWNQGEHMSLIGPTGTGKSYLALSLIDARAALSATWHCAILATKPRDSTLDKLRRRKVRPWTKVNAWPPPALKRLVLVWPPWKNSRSKHGQSRLFHQVIQSCFAAGSWCIYVDELAYCVRELGLEADLKDVWQQGRSLDLTLVAAFQRPAWVPLDAYSAATHLFFWRTSDDADLKRIAGLGGISSTLVRDIVSTLDHESHEVLYVNTRTGQLLRTHAAPMKGL